MVANDKGFRVLVGVFIAALILSIFGLFYGVTEAQDTVHTQFSTSCIEVLSPVHYRLHFGYTSTGVETFTVSTVANVSISNTVTTDTGYHILGYVDAYSTDSMVDNLITFTGANNIDVLHVNTWNTTAACEGSSVSPDATAEPAPETVTDDCPAWAVDGATGEMICLWSLPRYVGAN